jgi:hypothetical protein
MEAIFLACGAGGPQLKRNPLGSKLMRNFLALSLVVLGAPACQRPNSTARSTVDTTMVFVAGSATTPGPTIGIVVTRDAKVYVDGRPVPVVSLDSTLGTLRIRNARVTYFRAVTEQRTTPQQDSAIRALAIAVATNRLAITFLTRADTQVFYREFERSLHDARP